MKKQFAALALCSFLTTGCASIVSDSNYPVSIDSNPSQLNFTVQDESGKTVHSGRTPATVTLKSGDGYFSSANYTVTFTNKDAVTRTFTLNSQMDGWYIGNLLFGGLIGFLIVDPATGAMWKLPESQKYEMPQAEAVGEKKKEEKQELKIISLNNVPLDQRSRMVRVL